MIYEDLNLNIEYKLNEIKAKIKPTWYQTFV